MCRRHDRSTRFHGNLTEYDACIRSCNRSTRVIGISSNTRLGRVESRFSAMFRRLRKNWVTSVCRVSFEHSVSRSDNFSLRFGLLFFFFLSLARITRENRSNSSLFSEKNFFFVYSVGHAASTPNYYAKLFSLMASLSPCYIRGLPFSQGFCNLNIQTFSYLCFPRFHIHLPSINHRAIPFIASSLHFSIFTSSSSSGLHFTFLFSRLLLLLAFVPPCFPANRRRRGEGKKKSRIPGQRFQGSVTSLTNWLPRIQASLPRSCCSTDRAAYPLRLVEKRHRLVLRNRVESWPRESSV